MEASALTSVSTGGVLSRSTPVLPFHGDRRLVALIREGPERAFAALFDPFPARVLALLPPPVVPPPAGRESTSGARADGAGRGQRGAHPGLRRGAAGAGGGGRGNLQGDGFDPPPRSRLPFLQPLPRRASHEQQGAWGAGAVRTVGGV